MKEYYYVVNGRYFAGQGMSYELPGDLPTGVVAVEGKYSGGLEDYVPPDKPNTAKRMKEYPPIGDQLDALWKLIQANSDKIDLGEAAPILEKIQGVKSKYPKTP